MISSRQIEAFRAVMLTRSMTSAAGMLFVTQSAVSKLVRDLEEQVGFQLFTRRKGGLVPSVEASALFVEVDRLFIGIERIARAAERIRVRHHGHLRIVAMPSITTSFLPRVVKSFNTRCPDVGVSLLSYNSPEVIELVASGQFDLGYAMTPVDRDKGVSAQLHRVDCVCVLPPDHRLKRRRSLGAEDLANESFISLASGNATRLKIDGLFKNENVERRMLFDAGWSAGVVGLVANGMGVSILDPFAAELARALGCPVKPLRQHVEFSFAELRPTATPANELAELFGSHFQKCLKELQR